MRWAPLCVLALGLARQLQVNLRWLALDIHPLRSVYSSTTNHLQDALWLRGMGQLWSSNASGELPDLLSLSGIGGWVLLGRTPDAMIITVLVYLLLTQLALFELGRRLGSAWAGVLAALMLGVVPHATTMARSWSPEVPQMMFLGAALLALVVSRSFTRLLPTLAWVVLAIAGLSFSAMSTNNILFGLSLVGMTAGAWVRGLTTARGPLGDPPLMRWRVAATGLGAVALTVLGAWRLHFRNSPTDYYTSEAIDTGYGLGASWLSQFSDGAYLRWIAAEGMGPVLAITALVGSSLYAWRGRARAELLGLLLIPLLVLSAIPKKNPYYIAQLYPVLCLITALGFHRVAAIHPRLRRVGPALLAAVIATAWFSWEQRSALQALPFSDDGAKWSGLFQTAAPPRLHPERSRQPERSRRLIEDLFEGSSCPEGSAFAHSGVDGDLGLWLLAMDPCMRSVPSPDRPNVEWSIIADDGCTPGRRPAPEAPENVRRRVHGGAIMVDSDTIIKPCLWLLQHTDGEPASGQPHNGPPRSEP